MRLVLQKDVKNLGKAGDQVKVKDGYARNYLLPKKMALVFDESRIKDWKHKKQVIEVKKKQALTDRQQILKKVSAVEVCFEKESRSEGKLFGSVTAAEISNALEKEHKILIDKKDIVTDSLKEVGEYQIPVTLDSQNKTELKVIVKSKTLKKEKQDSKRGFFASRFFKKEEEDSKPEVSEESPTEKPTLSEEKKDSPENTEE